MKGVDRSQTRRDAYSARHFNARRTQVNWQMFVEKSDSHIHYCGTFKHNLPIPSIKDTRWFKNDRDSLHLFTHKSVPVIFEPPCIFRSQFYEGKFRCCHKEKTYLDRQQYFLRLLGNLLTKVTLSKSVYSFVGVSLWLFIFSVLVCNPLGQIAQSV